MFSDIYTIPSELAFQIPWEGRDLEYDLRLYTLGEGHDEFVVFNPERGLDLSVVKYIEQIPDTRKCVVWTYQGTWIAKLFKDGWYPYHGYETIEITKPTFIWHKNPDLDRSMTFDENLFSNYEPDDWEEHRKLIWYIDKRFNPLEDEVWAFSCEPATGKSLGLKNMGYVTPSVTVETNEHLDNIGLNIDVDSCCPPFWELTNECAYELDPVHQTDKRLWIIKFTPNWRKPKEWKWLGVISPEMQVTYNPDLPVLNYNMDYAIPWHDFNFEHVWYLDRTHLKNNEEDIWAFKITVSTNIEGSKFIDYVTPELEIEYNPWLTDVSYDIDYVIPHHDLGFEHMWMLDSKHTANSPEPLWAFKVTATDTPLGTKVIGDISPIHTIQYNKQVKAINVDTVKSYNIQYHDFKYEHVWYTKFNGQKIWVAKLTVAESSEGTKEVAVIDPDLPDTLDVVFISYGELNAEENWARVKEKAPYAKRITGVTGILEAHQAAAKISNTDMFYVVDGDAFLFKKFEFNYKPSIFDRDCTYIWSAKNPLIDLTYGHGGVKLFSKDKILKLKKWRTLDMTTSVSNKIKVMSEISNWTAFNTDLFSVWKTAFRECVKLAFNIQRYPDNPEHALRLEKWKSIDVTLDFGQCAKDASVCALEFVDKNKDNMDELIKINSRAWLEDMFNSVYKKKDNNG